MRPRDALLLVVTVTGCGRTPVPGPFTAFVPGVVRQTISGRVPWMTHIELTNPGPAAAEVRVYRSPPALGSADPELLRVLPGASVQVDTAVPGLPAVSSFFFESQTAFSVGAVIRASGDVAPPLQVPTLRLEDLAQPGDRLEVGPFVKDGTRHSHFCFSHPGTDRHLAPYEVGLDFVDPRGRRVGRALQILGGLPTLVEDPWRQYAIPDGTFSLEATFRGRAGYLQNGGHLWIYGVTTEKATKESHFLPVKVVRARR